MSCVMVIEDNDDLRELMAEFLRSEDYEVLEAENGRHALELLDKSPDKPCLLLLDLMMPVMSGIELLKTLEATGRLQQYPVIVISAGHFAHTDVPLAKKFMRKPPSFDALLQLVKDFCPPAANVVP